jgi:tRNA uridine 5-carboxymethylaminomethyl modification enzyme
MIDDLITLGTREPYRMFTSRAEYRLLLREDNADLRLREHGHTVGLLPIEEYRRFVFKKEQIETELARVRSSRLLPSAASPELLATIGLEGSQNGFSFEQLLRRPDISYEQLAAFDPEADLVPLVIREQVEIQIKYQGYIDRQLDQVTKMRGLEEAIIPAGFDYAQLSGLTVEVREKLERTRPDTLGQASRIPGVTPVAIAILSVSLKSKGNRE